VLYYIANIIFVSYQIASELRTHLATVVFGPVINSMTLDPSGRATGPAGAANAILSTKNITEVRESQDSSAQSKDGKFKLAHRSLAFAPSWAHLWAGA
jgi:hypothetical protein